MARRESTDFSNRPLLPKGCKECTKTFLTDFTASKYCINCNPWLSGIKKKKILLTEQQVMDILDLQWAMMEYNTAKADKLEAEEIEQREREVEEIRARVREKYEIAVLGNKNQARPTGVHVG